MKKETWKEAALFLAATFGMTWICWFAAYMELVPNSTFLITLGTMIPSVAGLIFTAKFEGKPRLKELFHAAVRFKAPWIWWLYAVLLFPVVLLLACAVLIIIGGSIPPAKFPLWFVPVAFFYIFACMGPLGEELGWRGFLLKRFVTRWNPIKSGFLLGFIWSAWHLPLFGISGTIQYELAKMGLFIAIPGYFVYTICISLLMSALYVRTDSNLLLCLAFHTICNLSLGTAPIILIKSGAAALLGSLILVTVFVLKAAARRPRKSSGPDKGENLYGD